MQWQEWEGRIPVFARTLDQESRSDQGGRTLAQTSKEAEENLAPSPASALCAVSASLL